MSIIVVNEIIFEKGSYIIELGCILYATSVFVILLVNFYSDGTHTLYVISHYFGSYTEQNKKRRSELIAKACDDYKCQYVICDRDAKNASKSEINEGTKNVYVNLISCCQHDILNIFIHAISHEMIGFNVKKLMISFGSASFEDTDSIKKSFFKKLFTTTRSQEEVYEFLTKIFKTDSIEDVLNLCNFENDWNRNHRENLPELMNFLQFMIVLKDLFYFLNTPMTSDNLINAETYLEKLLLSCKINLPAIRSLKFNLISYGMIHQQTVTFNSITPVQLSIKWSYQLLGAIRNASNYHIDLKITNDFLKELSNNVKYDNRPSTGYSRDPILIEKSLKDTCENCIKEININDIVPKNIALQKAHTASKMKSFSNYPYHAITKAFTIMEVCKENAGDFIKAPFVSQNIILFENIIKNDIN